ncbi:MAG: GNAT family N-acetyltransferase [Myxococcales bacterium]|nr:GNAT family N-acetyltransferase [Myxococcales bacterium]
MSEHYRYASRDDLPAILEMLADPRVGRWLWFVPAPEEVLRAHIEPLLDAQQQALAEGQEPKSAVFVVEDASGRFLGECAAEAVQGSPGSYEIGFQLAAHAWGRGVGTRAGRHVADWARAHGAHRLQASCLQGNTASRRVIEGLGLTREGSRPDFRLKDGVRHTELLFGCVVGGS